jgi:hypothetical protein
VVIHLFAMSYLWPRTEDGSFKNDVYVLLRKPNHRYDIYNITKIISQLENFTSEQYMTQDSWLWRPVLYSMSQSTCDISASPLFCWMVSISSFLMKPFSLSKKARIGVENILQVHGFMLHLQGVKCISLSMSNIMVSPISKGLSPTYWKRYYWKH